jgi:HPt (histidine-containing phosphotransfer) domain-containing protein
MTAIAFFNQTRPLQALLWSTLALLGPAIAERSFESPRRVSIVYGFTAMVVGALLVHFGQGPVQIEMHFYFFALLAMLAVYGNPVVILVAAVTVALHHLLLWFLFPSSVFNYDAPVWVVAVHAGFVVLESVATCYIARSFFDRVIGLEKIVQARTQELDAKNRDMRLVLDHVDQGLLMVDRDGNLSAERSAAVERMVGVPEVGQRFADFLGRVAPTPAQMIELGLDELREAIMPPEVTLDQMPKRFASNGSTFALAYTPITSGAEIEKLLVVVSDITAQCEKERLEAEQREMGLVVDRIIRDRAGLIEFMDEAAGQIAVAIDPQSDTEALKRALHTLKGNSALFGMASLATLCHELEDHVAEMRERPTEQQRERLAARFERLQAQVAGFLGGDRRGLEIPSVEYQRMVEAVKQRASHEQLGNLLSAWSLEPTRRRLGRLGEQIERLADRLGKGPVVVDIDDGGLRLDAAGWRSFWASFVHLLRNAVDHGLEQPEERKLRGKPAAGRVSLVTRIEGAELIVQIADDGKGIDWSAVAAKAAELGLPHASDKDLLEALFANGVSTKEQANEISGRGIGMGAIRSECAARSGRMEIESRKEHGTVVTFRFPRATAGVACPLAPLAA